MGEDSLDIYNSFTFTIEEAKRIDPIIRKFEEYFIPQQNVTFESKMFFSRKQLEAEPDDKWVTDLKQLSSTCEFGDLRDSLVKDAIVLGVQISSVKEPLIQDRELDISKAIEIRKISETSKQQLKDITDKADTPTVNVVAVK